MAEHIGDASRAAMWNDRTALQLVTQVPAPPLSGDAGRSAARGEVGPGGKQIQVEDPDGNPIEIHEAPA